MTKSTKGSSTTNTLANKARKDKQKKKKKNQDPLGLKQGPGNTQDMTESQQDAEDIQEQVTTHFLDTLTHEDL